MKGKKFGVVILGLCVVLAVSLVGCGDDGDSQAGFKAYIQHFGGDDLVPSMNVEAIDNETGQLLGISAKSDASGWVKFNGLPAGKVGFLCKGVPGDWVDTYQFNLDSDAQDERLWAVDYTTYTGVPLMAGLVLEDGKAILAGGVYWVNAQDEEEHIGCATVKANPESGDVRYFDDNGMPTKLEFRENTNPLVAYYVIANMDPGKADIEAYVDTQKIGTTQLHTYADSIAISNVYADTTSNPMPAGCQ
jgi:hypothetical protein